MEKVCQSCGLPLNERILGNENNGTFSQEYCYLCYYVINIIGVII